MTTLNGGNGRDQIERLGVMAQIGLLAGPFMTMIDSSIVNVALPDIAHTMRCSLVTVQWVASAYLLALGVALAGTAYLAKRFGTKRMYLISLMGFTAASVLCAAAPSVEILIAARMVQGAFGAPLVPLAMNMLFGRGRAEQQVTAAAGMILFLAPALGPALGGLLVRWAGWSSIFLINLPVGMLASIGSRFIPRAVAQEKTRSTRFDAFGFVLLASGLALVTLGSTRGPQFGWFSLSAWPYWAAGAMLLAAYVTWAIRCQEPIVDVILVRRPQQILTLALTALVSIVTFAVMVLVPELMQVIQGRSSVVAGLVLLPQGLITGIGTVLGNHWSSRWGVRRTVVLGMIILTVSTFGLLTVTEASPAWFVAFVLIGRGFAIGLVIQPLLNGFIKTFPEDKVPDGNTLFNVVERLSGTLGIAWIVSFFQIREQVRVLQVVRHLGLPASFQNNTENSIMKRFPEPMHNELAQAMASGFHDVISLVAGMSALGVVMALLIKDRWTTNDEAS